MPLVEEGSMSPEEMRTETFLHWEPWTWYNSPLFCSVYTVYGPQSTRTPLMFMVYGEDKLDE